MKTQSVILFDVKYHLTLFFFQPALFTDIFWPFCFASLFDPNPGLRSRIWIRSRKESDVLGGFEVEFLRSLGAGVGIGFEFFYPTP